MKYHEKYMINGVLFEIKQSNHWCYYFLYVDGVEITKSEFLHKVQSRLLSEFGV